MTQTQPLAAELDLEALGNKLHEMSVAHQRLGNEIRELENTIWEAWQQRKDQAESESP